MITLTYGIQMNGEQCDLSVHKHLVIIYNFLPPYMLFPISVCKDPLQLGRVHSFFLVSILFPF